MLGADDDTSLFEEYFAYLAGLFRGDLGISVTYFPTPVSQVVGQSLPWTLVLVGLATTITFIIGMVLGTVAGWKRGTRLDSPIPATTILHAVHVPRFLPATVPSTKPLIKVIAVISEDHPSELQSRGHSLWL